MAQPDLGSILWPEADEGRLPDAPLAIAEDWAARGFKWGVGGADLREIDSGRTFAKAGGASVGNTLAGPGMVVASTTDNFSVNVNSLPGAEATLVWAGEFTGGASQYASIFGFPDAAAPYFNCELQRNRSGGQNEVNLVFSASGFFNLLGSTATGLVAGRFVIIGTVKSGLQALYIKDVATGVVYESTYTVGYTPPLHQPSPAKLEIGDSVNARNANIKSHLALIGNQALSRAECYELLGNPYQVVAVTMQLPSPALMGGGGATNSTLACAAGSYTVTGKAATPTAARSFSGAGGSYSVTGRAATLSRGYSLTCAAGSYSITGKAATPTAGRGIAAAAGAYNITGQAATLTYVHNGQQNYVLACNPGSYGISGQSATLTGSTQNGWMGGPKGRKKRPWDYQPSAADVERQRIELGIIEPEPIAPAAKKVIRAVAKKAAENVFSDAEAQALLLEEMGRQHLAQRAAHAELMLRQRDEMRSRAVALALARQHAEDDEHAAHLLLI